MKTACTYQPKSSIQMCMLHSSKAGRGGRGQRARDTENSYPVRKEHLLCKTRAAFMLNNVG